MIFADGRLTMEGGFHSSFIFPICLLRKVVGCVQFFFPSNLIQNFKEKEDKKVVGCVRKVVFFNFFFSF